MQYNVMMQHDAARRRRTLRPRLRLRARLLMVSGAESDALLSKQPSANSHFLAATHRARRTELLSEAPAEGEVSEGRHRGHRRRHVVRLHEVVFRERGLGHVVVAHPGVHLRGQPRRKDDLVAHVRTGEDRVEEGLRAGTAETRHGDP